MQVDRGKKSSEQNDNTVKESSRPSVLFLSSARLTDPVDITLKKKWHGLQPFFRATVIAFRENGVPARVVFEGARWIMPPSRLPRFFRYLAHFIVSLVVSFWGCMRKHYDVIVAQTPYQALAPSIALLPWKILRLRSRPRLIVEIHSEWKREITLFYPSPLTYLELPFRYLIGRFAISQADAYRVISSFCRGLLPETTKPVYSFPTFTDVESFDNPPDAIVQAVAERVGKGFFIYVGMLVVRKGVHILLEAFKQVHSRYPDARLVIVGTGREQQRLALQAKQLHIGGQVIFAGQLDQQTLAGYIKNAIALILPSLSEALGRVVIEACLLEKPVIGSRVGGIPEIIIDGKTGILVEPGNKDALRDAMVTLLDNPLLALTLGEAARKRVLERFNYKNYFHSYYHMVREVCQR